MKTINFKNCYITKYIDGYIVKIFYYDNEWKFATSKHTNIKYFKIGNETLYNIFKKNIFKTFNTINDFLNLLDNNYCYSFILNADNISMINKINSKTLKEEFNFNKYFPLYKYNNKNNENEKFIIIEKKDLYGKQIINKIHLNIKDLEELLFKNICKYNNKCFDKSCNLIHAINPNIDKNYEKYIVSEKNKNKLFKTNFCKNNDNCIYHLKNKCKYIHEDDPIQTYI